MVFFFLLRVVNFRIVLYLHQLRWQLAEHSSETRVKLIHRGTRHHKLRSHIICVFFQDALQTLLRVSQIEIPWRTIMHYVGIKHVINLTENSIVVAGLNVSRGYTAIISTEIR